MIDDDVIADDIIADDDIDVICAELAVIVSTVTLSALIFVNSFIAV